MKITSSEYKEWICELKQRIRQTQIKAAVKVNTELLKLYWELGCDIVERQKKSQWGDGFLKQLSQDLMTEFPEMNGFSYRNIKYIRQWYVFYSQDDIIGKQLVSQLEQDFFAVPWGHHILIIQRCKDIGKALFYIQQTIENNWSRTVLDWQIDSNLYERQGKAVDKQMRMQGDNPTIGILICKDKNDVVVEYTLQNVESPIGISSLQIYDRLTEDYKSSLPTIEEIEAQLKDKED